jgi:uncharacterized protein YegL
MGIRCYLAVDTSGSTVRRGRRDGALRALPPIVALLEATGDDSSLTVVGFATTAAVTVPMTRAADVALLPAMATGGFSSLAAAFRLLAGTVPDDARQLVADGRTVPRATVVVIIDGLPTDRDQDVLDARDRLDADLHLILPPEVPALPVAGLRCTRHRLDGDAPAEVASSIESAVRRILGG